MSNLENVYLVSLVYEKTIEGTRTTFLRHAIRECNSKEEALGMLILQLEDEMNDCRLSNKAVTCMKDFCNDDSEKEGEG